MRFGDSDSNPRLDDMSGEEFDRYMDSLPARQRAKILWGQHKPTPAPKEQRKWWWLGCVAAFLWCIPWNAAGAVLCLTIIGAPIGLLFVAIGSMPLTFCIAKISSNRVDKQQGYMIEPPNRTW